MLPALSDASNSLIGNANLISKVYFPRLIVPIGGGGGRLRRFPHQLRDPGGADGLVPVRAGLADSAAAGFAALAFMASLGVGVWITALNVKYRDFRYVIPFIVQFGLYVSPVGFSSSIIPDAVAAALFAQSDGRRHRRLSLVHPRRREPALSARLWLSLGVAGFFLWFGIRQFRKMEKSFADLI